ncbi:MAG: hypothetical protein AAF891_09205 [Pseudomonadota bacterium]
MEHLVNRLTDNIFQIIGVIGFALYVGNYLLLTFDILRSDTIAYFALNLVASSFVLVSLTHSFNLASLLIQLFWIGISVIAIAMRWRPKAARAVAS